MSNLKILLIEDDKRLSTALSGLIKDKTGLDVICAYTLKEAEEKIRTSINEISIIILDACLEVNFPNTIPLITLSKNLGFKGPIIACSSLDEYNEVLLRFGADLKVKSGKLSVLKTLEEILK